MRTKNIVWIMVIVAIIVAVALKTVSAQGVPDAPQNLSVTASASTRINLTWGAVSTATSYKVYRSVDTYGTFAPIATSTLTGTSYPDTTVSPEMTYYYKVTAVNSNGESAYSGMAYVTTPAPAVPAPVRSNGQPTGALSFCTTQTTVSLATNENATCKYSTAAGTSYASMANTFSITGATTHSTPISGLTIGSSYTYYIRCQDAAGNKNTDDYTISFSVAYALAPASAINKIGYTLMKVTGSNDIWVVQNGLKLPVRSLDVFNGSGYVSANVETVSASAFEAVESASLIKTNDNPDVYLFQNNFRRKLASTEIFNSYNLDWKKIEIASQPVMSSFAYAPIYKHGSDLYWRDSNNLLHKFPTMAIFTAKGYNTRDLITVNDMEFGSFAIGENITP